ncbi:MAG: FkbM family methyltransferase [Alphaproteobacteria bacterium]|uniref:FkbM family methyltransferase n=2 Tax=Alphaproteobacteria TaxID=28211 RepID=UPI0032669C12
MMKQIAITVVRLITAPLSETGRRRVMRLIRRSMGISGFDAVVHDVPSPRGTMKFYCLGNLPLWRAETALSKEPETIEWIDGMVAGDVLFDIGANIGVYTLYAAVNRDVQVLAFEPLAANYYLLNRNIEENGLSDVATAYSLALTDTDKIGRFHAQDTEFGSALSSFGQHIEQYGQSHASDFEQGMIGMRLDTFIETFGPPFPTHLKIDVDGIEDQIIAGAPNTLADPRLQSISIELDSTQHDYVARVTKAIKNGGLRFIAKRRSAMFDNTPSANTYNYLFRR